jgi:hypothetical protein
VAVTTRRSVFITAVCAARTALVTKPLTRGEVAAAMNVSAKTASAWLREFERARKVEPCGFAPTSPKGGQSAILWKWTGE